MSKKHIKYLKTILISISSVWFINGCVDDNFNLDELSTHVENESVWNFPVANTNFLMEDIINLVDSTGLITTDDEGLIMLVYSDTGYSATAREEVVFPDQDYETVFNEQDFLNAGGFVNNTANMQKANVNYLFIAAAANQLLDSVLIESSLLDINISSTFNYKGKVTIIFPELKRNGTPYQKIIDTDNSGNFNTSITFNDMNGYMLDFTNFGNPLENNFFVTYELELYQELGSGSVSPDAICDIDVQFREIQYEYIWGYLGTQSFEIPVKEVETGFFSGFDLGEFELKNPRVTATIKNSFGLEIGVCLPTFQMLLPDEVWYPIEGPEVPTEEDPWIISSPNDTYPSPLTPSVTTVMLTGEGTNLDELISQLPRAIQFGEEVKLNPNETGEKNNFMSKDSRVDVTIDLEVPLWGRTAGIVYTDTLDMDVGDITEDIDMIDYFDINLKIGNGLPHNLGVIGYLTDSLYNIIDTIPNSNDLPLSDTLWVVQSGVLGSDNIINQETEKTVTTSTIRYDDDVDILDDVKYLILSVKFLTTEGNTPDAPYVKYFDFYGMDLSVSVGWKMNFSEDL
jgi:hypothetical protein